MSWLKDLFRTPAAEPREAVTGAQQQPVPAAEWKARGNAAMEQWNLAEAARCYGLGAQADPADATLRLNLGFALLEQGDFTAAAERLEQALALRRDGDGVAADAHYLLARANAGLSRWDSALRACEQALRSKPDFAEALEEGVRALLALQRNGDAAQWSRRLVALRPSIEAQLLHAAALDAAGNTPEAVQVLAAATAAEPTHPEASSAYFAALFNARRFDDALAEAQRLLAAIGPHPAALGNLAAAWGRLGQPERALAAVQEALSLRPGHRGLLANQVALLQLLGRPREAASCAREGLRIHPDDADLHWNLAVNLLLLGDFEEGWAEHEWRNGPVSALPKSRWRGESLEGRSILLHGEQGFGDAIQFLRFVPEVASRAQTVHVRVLRPLAGLRLDLPANCVLAQDAAPPATDYECPLMSLPAVLGTTEATIPARVPYVHAEAAAVREWRERLSSHRVNVGIAWSGNPANLNDLHRSMPLATLLGAAVGDVRFVTVQTEVREADRATLDAHPEVFDARAHLRSFADTAALLETLDLVLTVDTSVAHLAGAMGRPVWVLLPWVPDWRWMLERSDSPWYPTARLFRQDADRRWEPVVERVRAALAQG
ncbi:tetratricopeptide repeat protein [Ramlibacter sp. PS4R-6]|uniref:tetratricopeptide repeat protein n=1 Tax=Ramlibacter sp. PS4R-6 TaxID=3133438 RepID=UPI0030A14774